MLDPEADGDGDEEEAAKEARAQATAQVGPHEQVQGGPSAEIVWVEMTGIWRVPLVGGPLLLVPTGQAEC